MWEFNVHTFIPDYYSADICNKTRYGLLAVKGLISGVIPTISGSQGDCMWSSMTLLTKGLQSYHIETQVLIRSTKLNNVESGQCLDGRPFGNTSKLRCVGSVIDKSSK